MLTLSNTETKIVLTFNFQVDLRHKDEERDKTSLTKSKKMDLGPPPVIEVGIDLSEFYMSVEWDILEARPKKSQKAAKSLFTHRIV